MATNCHTNRLNNFSKMLGGWCHQTTAHGYGHLVNSNSKRSMVFWGICIILCSFIGTQQILQLALSFLSPKTKWTTSVYEMPDQKVKEPTITICNYNRILKSKASKADFTPELMTYYFGFFPVLYPISVPDGSGMSEAFAAWQKKNNLSRVGVLEKLGNDCEKTVLLGGRTNNRLSGKQLCEGDKNKYGAAAVPILTAEMGLCFQIQVNSSGVTLAGSLNSINLILDTKFDEYVDVATNNFQDVGFAIQITYDGKTNFGQWTSIEAAKHTNIAIQEHHKITTYNAFSLFEPGCIHEPKMRFIPASEYSIEMCAIDCAAITTGCHCSLVLAKDSPICEIQQVEKCLKASSFNLDIEQWSFGGKRLFLCMESCKPLCQSDEAEMRISTSSYPSSNQINAIKEHSMKYGIVSSFDHANKDQFASVDVYYKTLSVKVTERHVRSTFDQLISNIGGQLGLWLGASVLTLVHLIVSLCSWISDKRRKKKQTDNVSPEANETTAVRSKSLIPVPIVPEQADQTLDTLKSLASQRRVENSLSDTSEL